MALSNVTGAGTKAPVDSKPKAVVSGGAQSDTKRRNSHAEFKTLGESLGAKMSAEEKAKEGTKRGAVAFVCALGNPKMKQDRVSKGQIIPCFKPVGYKFKALENIVIPVIPLKDNCASLIDVAVENATTRPVKAGEEFVLNLREYGALISQTEYNGSFSGEGREVFLGVTFSGERTEPYPILKSAAGAGSIKENMELIANEEIVKGADGADVKKYTVKPEYAEKFGMLFKTHSAKRTGLGSAKSSEAGVAASNIARALQDYYNKH